MTSARSSTKMNCALSERCSGCDRIDFDRATLEADRRAELEKLGLGDIPTDFVWISAGGLRDRLEFTMANSRFGLFEKSRDVLPSETASPIREIVDIDTCPQLSTRLQTWLTEFRRDLPTLTSNPSLRGSVRLRVSPAGLRGVWLDFANEDVRDLLEEGEWLERQLENGVVVEVGQKRKRIEIASEATPTATRRHRLVDPVLEAWFETPLALDTHSDDGSSAKPGPAALYSTVGTFTQPGFRAQAALTQNVLAKLADLTKPRRYDELRFAEFGSGIGAFTLPLLSTGARVDVFEFDRLALSALERGVAKAGLERSRLQIHAGDFIQSSRAFESHASDLGPYDIVLVDPPRPGLGSFLPAIESRAANASWIYVSCFPESFMKDAEKLRKTGLKLETLTVVEQFPYTHHFELVAAFRRSKL
jgi:23S rRNA (uracil1939-C5)-methyltransferase